MKLAGFVIVVIGLLLLLSPAFSSFVMEQITDVEALAADIENDRTINWKHYLGFGVLFLGIALFMLGIRRRPTV